MKTTLTLLTALLLAPLATMHAAEPPAAMKAAPAAANLAGEPIRKQFSAAKAAEFLDANAHYQSKCVR